MNHDCFGKFFILQNDRYYICLLDSNIRKSKLSNGDTCPNCKRTIVVSKNNYKARNVRKVTLLKFKVKNHEYELKINKD